MQTGWAFPEEAEDYSKPDTVKRAIIVDKGGSEKWLKENKTKPSQQKERVPKSRKLPRKQVLVKANQKETRPVEIWYDRLNLANK